MIVYHETTIEGKGTPVWNALVDGKVYIPYNTNKSYVEKRAKYFEGKLKDPTYVVEFETITL